MPVRITFLGTGSLEDWTRTNTAYVIEHDGYTIQVDAGFNVFNPLCKYLGGIEALKKKPDLILLTHQHGDHIGSLPQETLAMWRACFEAGTTRDLYITGEPDAVASFDPSNELDYKGFMEKLYRQKINFLKEPIGKELRYAGFTITHAPTKHAVTNYAYRFDADGFSFAISGDGLLTPESKGLFDGVNLLIHDGFRVEDLHPSHASVKEILDYAKDTNIEEIAIVHMDLPERSKTKELEKYQRKAANCETKLWTPDDGNTETYR